jgi:hypothetical protein
MITLPLVLLLVIGAAAYIALAVSVARDEPHKILYIAGRYQCRDCGPNRACDVAGVRRS